MSEKLYFETITKKHDLYYTEYHPPQYNSLFAILSINFIFDVDLSTVIDTIEREALHWFEIYPLPLMTSAVDKYGNYIHLTNIKEKSFLILLKEKNELKKYWSQLENEGFPNGIINNNTLLEIYKDIPYRTQEKVTQDAKDRLKPIIMWNRFYVIWGLYIPIAVAIIGYYSPRWLTFFVMCYSIYKAIKAYRKTTGKIQLTDREKEKEEKQRKMEHYFVHCEKNPNKFLELKSENFKREKENDILKKFNSLQ